MNEKEKENYAERINKVFDDFINRGFINYSPWEKSDDEIIEDAHRRSGLSYEMGLMSCSQHFAAIYTIEGSGHREWCACEYEVLCLKPYAGNSIEINFSDFRYMRSLDKSRCSSFGYTFDPNGAQYINKVNDKTIDPISLSEKQQILVGYRFGTINSFGKYKECYRLYSLSGDKRKDAEIIRRQILRAQAFTLLMLARHPYMGVVGKSVSEEHYNIAEATIKMKEREIRTKLSTVEAELRKRGMTYEIILN